MNLSIDRTWAERPLGMRDIFPQQAKLRRKLESRLLEFLERKGYEMVSSGAFEYVETLLRGRAGQESADWWRVFDASGRTVVLRPDMTPSIARMAAPLLSSGCEAVKWCYAERVYRRTNDPASLSWASGRAAEVTQVGVEWIGQTGHVADAELLALCLAGSAELGLQDSQLVVSHARFAPAFLASFGLPEETCFHLIECLVKGDYVGFSHFLADGEVAVDVLELLSRLNPFMPEAVPAEIRAAWDDTEAGRETAQCWDDLLAFADLLRQRGLETCISFDLTLCRDVSYYTGVVFELFAHGVGAPVAVGGRYDDLLSQFGAAAPAIGFAFEVERLLTALTEGAWLDSGSKEGQR